MIAGLGGLYFVMEYSGGTWTDNGFGDRGWLAVALVIFALWKPLNAIWGAFLFCFFLYLISQYSNCDTHQGTDNVKECVRQIHNGGNTKDSSLCHTACIPGYQWRSDCNRIFRRAAQQFAFITVCTIDVFKHITR